MSCPAMLSAITTPGLNQTERMLYAYLVGRANGARLTWPAGDEIGRDLGIKSRQTLAVAIRTLRERGLIAVKRRFRDTNHYCILDPDGLLYESKSTFQAPWEAQNTDVQQTTHLEAADVQQTTHLSQNTDVQQTTHLGRVDVQQTAHPLPSNVQQTAQESKGKERILRRRAATQRTADKDSLLRGKPRDVWKAACAERIAATAKLVQGNCYAVVATMLERAGGDRTIVEYAVDRLEAVRPSKDKAWGFLVATAAKRAQALAADDEAPGYGSFPGEYETPAFGFGS